jgi:Mn-dependent DtxR family transcriptional regulator
VSEYYIELSQKIGKDYNEIHELIRGVEIDIKSDTKKKLEKLMEQIIKKIPTTNEELLKEIQQMRDDFLALRQNF